MFTQAIGQNDYDFLLAIVLVPILTAILQIFFDRLLKPSRFQKNLSHFITVIGATADLVIALMLADRLLNSNDAYLASTELLTIKADLTALFFIMIFTLVHFAVSIYCINYMDHFDELARFYALLFSCVAGLNLIVLVQDFFTLFIAWEAMALCGYTMVGFYRSKESSEAGFKYLMMSSMGSVLALYGTALIYGFFGHVDFAFFETINPALLDGNLLLNIGLLLMIVGFGVTAAIFFLNTWLPDAHPAAPPPAHAMLSGIVTLGGIYAILRILILFLLPMESLGNINWSYVLIFLGIATSLQGNLYILIQFRRSDPQARNMKRIFAFSTISHMGYLITGFGAANLTGLTGVLMHALNHAVAKGVLFMITGYLIYATGTYYLDQYKGFGRRDPLMGVCLVIGLGSLASIPLTGGFWSKTFVMLGLFQNGTEFVALLAGISMLAFTFLAAAGYLWMIKYIVFDKSDQDQIYIDKFDSMNWKNAGSMKIAYTFLAVVTLFLGILPGGVIEFAIKAINALGIS